MKSASVYYWIEGEARPVLAGCFEWQPGQGLFRYDSSYLRNEKKVAIDPVAMPLGIRRHVQIKNNGIFGAFLDASADAWGKKMLERTHGAMDDFDVLLRSSTDSIGAVSVGELDQKSAVVFGLQEVKDVANRLSGSQSLFETIHPTTSIGGMKPKVSVSHKNELWIAKFTERGDHLYLPQAESAMLNLAATCGISSCINFTEQLTEDRYALLIKRFDRDGGAKKGFVSAHTALGLNPDSSIKDKSYLRLAQELQRWSASDLMKQRQELWRRIVFNALIGNADDHSRNHGLLATGKEWRLSPAFDLVPFPHKRERIALSMSFTRDGQTVATRDSLLADCKQFGYSREQAASDMDCMAYMVSGHWQDHMIQAGMPENESERYRHSFILADALAESRVVATAPSF